MTEELGGFRAPYKWEFLTVEGGALRDSVSQTTSVWARPFTWSCRDWS